MRLSLVVSVTAVVIMFVWGLSWGWAEFPDCASGSYFLADLPWLLTGIGLVFALALVGAFVFGSRSPIAFSYVATVGFVAVIAIAGQLGAMEAARGVGCAGSTDDLLEPLFVLGAAGATFGYAAGLIVRHRRSRKSGQA